MSTADSPEIKEGYLFRCGPHYLGCGDLVKGHFMNFFGNMSWQWTYSDPPWGEGLAKMFRTMNGQKGIDPKYSEMLERWAEVAAHSTLGVFGEMGSDPRWRNDLIRPMDDRGFEMQVEWEVTYNSGKPSLVQYFCRENMLGIYPLDTLPDLSGLTGASLVKRAMSFMKPGHRVADPCIGLGHTLRAGHAMGLPVLGMELNPKRLHECLKWCAKKEMMPQLIYAIPSASTSSWMRV